MPGLNDTAAAYFSQWTKLNTLLNDTDSAAAIASIPAVADGLPTWNTGFGGAITYNNKANASTTGITDAKDIAKLKNATTASTIAGRAVSYAILKNLPALKAQMKKFTFSKLSKGTNDPDMSGVVTSINTTLTPYITSDPIIAIKYFTTATLAAMMTDNTTFTGKLGKYSEAIGYINGAKRDMIIIQKPILDAQILYFEGFMTDLKVAYPDFVNAFRAIVKKIAVIGKRSQGMDGVLNNSVTGLPIGLGGLAEITNYPPVAKPKIMKTNSMSVLKLMNLKIGIWHVKFTCQGYHEQTITITIVSKKVVSLEVQMVPL